MKDKNIIAIIPARGGSRGIPKKNIIDLGGFPLLAYSVAAARLSKNISRIIVSTDSQEIADIAKKYGAEVPFLRPDEFAGDSSPDADFVKHALNWLKENEDFEPKYLVHLRPTTPLRDPELIDRAIEEVITHSEATSLRSAHELREPPHKFFEMDGEFFKGLFPDDTRPDYHNMPRQAFRSAYHPNGYVDVIKAETLKNQNVIHGSKIMAFVTPFVFELDASEDLDYIKFDLQRKNHKVYEFLKNNYGDKNQI